MATGAKAIGRLAAETGTLMASVHRAARSLQTDGLWPLGTRGGGQTTPHVEPHHLVNLMLAMACADPITESAKAVARYRPLIVADTLEIQEITTSSDGNTTTVTRKTSRPGVAAALLHGYGNTFGAWLDGWLLAANKPSGRSLRDFAWSALSVSMVLDSEFPEAAMSITTYQGDDPSRRRVETSRFLITHESDMPNRPSPPPAALVRSVTVPFPFFEAIEAAWSDTVAHRVRKGEMHVTA